MKYNSWTLGQVEAVFNKLGGDGGVRDFLSDKLIVRPTSHWLIWKTVKIGTGPQSFLFQMLRQQGVKFGSCLLNLLKSYRLPIAVPMEIDLVKVSGKELGFAEEAYRDEIYDCAKKLGLELCPPEAGFCLPLQCDESEVGSRPTIISSAMVIDDLRGVHHLIAIWHNGSDFWIEAFPDDRHNPFSKRESRTSWIFHLPRK